MSFQADDGTVVSDTLIVNCTITTLYGKHRLYIRQIYRSGTSARITIASVLDDQVLGMFYGDVTSDFTALTFTPFIRNISGSMTIGSSEAFAAIINTLHFTKNSAELEESTIFCYTPPAVTSISDKRGTQLRGDVNFGVLTNIKKSNTVEKTSQFVATTPAAVFNLADKSTYLDNCPTPIIKTINHVEPYPIGGVGNLPGNDGNIYIVGVKPIVFYGVPVAVAVNHLVVGTGIAINTIIISGSEDTWTLSVNQTTNTAIDVKVYRPVWMGKAYITGTTFNITSTAQVQLAKDYIVLGTGIATTPSYTVISSGSGKIWTVNNSQTAGTLTSPISVTAYEPTWTGKVSTTAGTKTLKLISTAPATPSSAGAPGTLKVQTQGVSLDSLCTQKHKLLPPVDICGFTNPIYPNIYYSKLALGATGSVAAPACSKRPTRTAGSYYITIRPEYYFWPQFVKDEYFTTYWNNLY